MADGDSEDDYVASEGDDHSSIASEGGSSYGPATQSHIDRRLPKPNNRSAKGYLSNDYRDLLNIDIEDARGHCNTTELDASQIGASRWTAREKEALFQTLSSRGPDNLQALGRAVRTKSEPEIRVYILALRAAASVQDLKPVDSRKRDVFSHDKIPAAAEISPEGEDVLELAADALATHVEKHISQQQQEKLGHDWLVDGDMAERMDSLYEQNLSETENVTKISKADGADSKDAPSQALFNSSFDTLLRPSAFLQLSRNIFMNNGEDSKSNWHHVDPISTDSMEPALFRSALEDFRNVSVNITRRVVQATIFQATSRLRAEDASRKDWSPLGAIREIDVRTAVDFLGLPRDSKNYWRTATRRCRVGVFSDSKKYADGRPSTKSGHRLTHDEVEAELGLRVIKTETSELQSADQDYDKDDIDELMDDSDLFTDEETDTSNSEPARDQSSAKTSKKRKRAVSPSSYLRAETRHLEAVDEAASLREERRLWELLRRDPPQEIKTDRTRSTDKLSMDPTVANGGDWRSNTEYDSDWEQISGRPTTECFKNMEAVGKAGKANREALMRTLQERLLMSSAPGVDVSAATQAKGDVSSDEESEIDMKPVTDPVGSDDEERG